MDIPDLITSCFGFCAGVMIWNNCRVLIKHRNVKGISVVTQVFFMIWGYWNLFYFSHLRQWLTFSSGACIVLANTAWVALAIYYTKKYPRR